MGLIEPFVFADSQDEDYNNGYTGHRVRREFSDASPYSIAWGIYTSLVDAGWEVYAATKASCELALPAGAPIKGPPREPKLYTELGIAMCKVGGTTIRFYDSGRQTHGSPPASTWIDMGVTLSQSLGYLATAIFGAGGWVAVDTRQIKSGSTAGWWVIEFEALVPGLEGNGTTVGGPSEFVGAASSVYFINFVWPKGADINIGPAPSGGGYTMRSYQKYGSSPEIYLEALISTSLVGLPTAEIELRPSTGQAEQYPIVHLRRAQDLPAVSRGAYTCIANQFQFLAFRQGIYSGDQLLVSLPYLRSEKCDYAAVVAAANTFRQRFQWAQYVGKAAGAAESGFSHWLGYGDPPNTSPGLYCLRYRPALLTPAETPIVSPAYLGSVAAYPAGADARLVGYLWDSLIVHKDYPFDTRQMWGIKEMQCVGRNAYSGYQATQATLWVAYGDE